MKKQLLTYLTAGTLIFGSGTNALAVNDSTIDISQAKDSIAEIIQNEKPSSRRLESVLRKIRRNINYHGDHRFKVKFDRRTNRIYGFEDMNRDNRKQSNEQSYFEAFLKENGFNFFDHTKPNHHRNYQTSIPYDIQTPVRHNHNRYNRETNTHNEEKPKKTHWQRPYNSTRGVK